jgi:CubicO group peptidase (beta-lactamase class C family)
VRRSLLTGLWIAACASVAHADPFPLIADLFSWDARTAAAVSIVQGDSVVYSRQFGHVDREGGGPITEDTIFYAGGALPPILGLAALTLHERRRLDLNAPLSEALSALVLEGGLAESLTVADLLIHDHPIRDGVASARIRTCDFTSDLLVKLIGHHGRDGDAKPRFRSVSYLLTGLAMEEAVGSSWDDILQDVVFAPLGMSSTTCAPSEVPAERTPLLYYDGPDRTEHRGLEVYGPCAAPAATFFTTAGDLSRWVIANLNEGRLGSVPVFPEHAVSTAHELYLPDGQNISRLPFTNAKTLGHGVGWIVLLYEGETALYAGSSDLSIALLPSGWVGLVMLSARRQLGGLGADPASFVKALAMSYVFDTVLGKEGAREEHLQSFGQLRTMFEQLEMAMASEPDVRSRPDPEPIPPEALVGAYESPLLGRMTCELVGEELELAIGRLRGVASRAAYPGVAEYHVEPIGLVTFDLGEDGRAKELRWSGQSFARVDF